MFRSTTIRYQYDNHLGSACLELDEKAQIVTYEEYHPFGTTSYRSGRSEIETSLKRYKYIGKERDDETGLYYYGARYYAAWLCRWISTDPAGFVDGLNMYAYVRNNPLKYSDPTGKQSDNEVDQVHVPENLHQGDIYTDAKGQEFAFEEGIGWTAPETTIEGDFTGDPTQFMSDATKRELGLQKFELEQPGRIAEIEVPEVAPLDKMESISPQQFDTNTDLPEISPRGETEMASNKTPENKYRRKLPGLLRTLFTGYVDKTKKLLEKGGKQIAKATKFVSKVGKGVAGINIGMAIIDAFLESEEKGFNWKIGAKAAIGVTLGGLSLLGFPLITVGLIYGVLDFFGVIDWGLDQIEKGFNNMKNFFKEVRDKTKRGIYDINEGLKKGWKPGY